VGEVGEQWMSPETKEERCRGSLVDDKKSVHFCGRGSTDGATHTDGQQQCLQEEDMNVYRICTKK
jgi:hypothetical protein